MISTSSLQQQKPLRFFARITGISPGIFYLSSSTFQRQIAVIGAGMLFTASFSGILLALSIHYFYQHILATLGGFCLSFVFTLLLDRKLICATLPLGFLSSVKEKRCLSRKIDGNRQKLGSNTEARSFAPKSTKYNA